jgi:ELWxxDGT repeat protein
MRRSRTAEVSVRPRVRRAGLGGHLLLAEALEPRQLLAAELIADLNRVTPDTAPASLVSNNTTAFFSGYGVGQDRTALWKSDGTAGGTDLVKSFLFAGGSRVGEVVTAGERAYFLGGEDVWTSDGTNAGTVNLTNGGGPHVPLPAVRQRRRPPVLLRQPARDERLRRAGDVQAVQVGRDGGRHHGCRRAARRAPPRSLVGENRAGAHGDGRRHDLLLDERSGSDRLVAERRHGGRTFRVRTWEPSVTGDCSWLTAVGNTVFFKGHTGTTSGVPEFGLFRTDGTAAGTTLVRDLIGRDAGDFVAFNGALFFRGLLAFYGPTRAYELCRSDGTPAGTGLFKDLGSQTTSSWPTGLRAGAGGALYFSAGGTSNGPGPQLWRSDGTPAGTVQVLPSLPGSNDGPTGFVAAGA